MSSKTNPNPSVYIATSLLITTACLLGVLVSAKNFKSKLFGSKEVRRALAMSMPRDEINKKIFCNLSKPAVGPLPRKSPKTDPRLEPIAYDLETAKTLLEKQP